MVTVAASASPRSIMADRKRIACAVAQPLAYGAWQLLHAADHARSSTFIPTRASA